MGERREGKKREQREQRGALERNEYKQIINILVRAGQHRVGETRLDS